MTEAPRAADKSRTRRETWKGLARTLPVPILLYALVLVAWVRSDPNYDESILRDWLDEAQGFSQTLPDMVATCLRLSDRFTELEADPNSSLDDRIYLETAIGIKKQEIREHLRALGEPATKIYSAQLPLFPVFYLIEVRFDDGREPITWDSNLSRSLTSESSLLRHRLGPRAEVHLRYRLHTYNKQQKNREVQESRVRGIVLLVALATVLTGGWLVYLQRRELERERQHLLAEYQVNEAERQLLEGELRRQEAERRRQAAESLLLQEELRRRETERDREDAERRVLELQSQLYASIGIMAGSYAHNIKNLLVRPNDLLRRCVDAPNLAVDHKQMLQEVQQALGAVTERVQQILRTVRRDPTQSQKGMLDLRVLLRDTMQTWKEMAHEKWRMEVVLDLPEQPLWIEGDSSHLMQTLENLLFNARDAISAMYNHLREQARETPSREDQRRGVLAAAAWRGRVTLRAWQQGESVVLSVTDNGIGMTDEVRRRCTETHFSTKREDARLHAYSTGMGLGLSFVAAVLNNHQATLEIESAPLQGATFLVRFPARQPSEKQVAAG
jgi:signal transduction histidine kinase